MVGTKLAAHEMPEKEVLKGITKVRQRGFKTLG